MTKEQKGMRINGMIIAALGLALTISIWTPLYPLGKLFLSLALWPYSPAPDVLDPTNRLVFAIGGGLTAGVGAMIWSIGTEVMPVAPVEGRKVVLYSALTWFAIDSILSCIAGAPFNAVLNLFFLALMLGPIDFKKRQALAE